MDNLKPSADRVIIRPETDDERKIGSIIIPATAWTEYITGIVVAVGPGPTGEGGRCSMTSKVGDKVIYPPSLGRPVPVRQADGFDKEYHVIRQHEITITLGNESDPGPKKATRKKAG